MRRQDRKEITSMEAVKEVDELVAKHGKRIREEYEKLRETLPIKEALKRLLQLVA